MIIRAFLAREHRVLRGLGQVTLSRWICYTFRSTHYIHLTLDYPPSHHFLHPSPDLPSALPPFVPPWLLLGPPPQSSPRFPKGLALSAPSATPPVPNI